MGCSMSALESTFWICLGKCAHWLLEIQDSRNRLSEWGVLMCHDYLRYPALVREDTFMFIFIGTDLRNPQLALMI